MRKFNIKEKSKSIIAALVLSAALMGTNIGVLQPDYSVVHAESVIDADPVGSNGEAQEESNITDDESSEVLNRTGEDVKDEETSNEEILNEGSSNEEASDEETLNEEASDEGSSNDEASNEGASDEGSSNEEASDNGSLQEETDAGNAASEGAGTADDSENIETANLNEDVDGQSTSSDDSSSSDSSSATDISAATPTDADLTKPTLTLRSMSLAKTYDGKPLTNADTALEVETGWKEGDGADYTFTESQTAIGSTLNKFTITPWPGTDLNEYTLDISYGDLTVTERLDSQKYILTITGVSGNSMYLGTEQTLAGFTLSGRSDYERRVEGSGDPAETVSFTVGDATFTVTGISAMGRGTDAGSYMVDITGSPVVYDSYGNNVTSEFSFEYYAGTFTIDKRSVILTSDSDKKKYDGKALKAHNVTVSGDGFVEGQGASYTFTGKQKEVGESYNYFDYTLNEGTSESNYKIDKVPGKLKVTKADDAESSGSSSADSSNETSGSGSSSEATSYESQSQSSEDVDTTAGTTAVNTEAASENANVLGANRTRSEDTGSDRKSDISAETSDVLGARRGATEDNTADTVVRFNIMFAAAIAASLLIRRNKRNYNG